jgi:hypothetical protein
LFRSGGKQTALASGGAFVTGLTFRGSPGGAGEDQNGWLGMQITVGSRNLMVTALGRWVLPGNSATHTLQILDAASQSQIGPPVTVNLGGATPNQFRYATLSSSVILAAGRSYFIVSSENQYAPGNDQLWLNSSASTFTTTGDATLNGSAEQDVFRNGQWFLSNEPHQMHGPVNFQYTATSALATFPSTPFVPLGRSTFPIDPQAVIVASGTTILDAKTMQYDFRHPAVNSVVIQWWIDGQPVGPQILGPQNPVDAGVGPFWPFTLDTTTLTDGTHAVFLQCVDVRPNSANNAPAYVYQSLSLNLIVQNTGPLNGAQRIPIAPYDSGGYQGPPMPDWAQYNGDPTRSVNGFPYPTPPIPPATSPSSPYFTNPALLRSPDNYYCIDLPKLKTHEYEYDYTVVTTPQGGVLTGATNPSISPTFDAQVAALDLAHFTWEGFRCDSRVDPFSTWIAEISDNGFVGTEMLGRVVWTDIQGNITTLAGLTLDRTNKLAYHNGIALQLTAAQNETRYKVVGNVTGFSTWVGLNDLCYDPRNPHRLYVGNLTAHFIIKIDLSTNPQTCTRFAGTENVSGYSGDGGDPLRATFNQPWSIIMGSDGVLYVADKFNGAIRTITTDGGGNGITIDTLCGVQANKPTPTQLMAADRGLVNGVKVDWNPAGSVTLSTAYINDPTTIKFAAGPTTSTTAKIVLYEADSNTIRLIDLAAQTVTRHFQMNQNLRNPNFSWFDIDVNGACGPVNDMLFCDSNSLYMRCALDGSYIQQFYGDVAAFTPPSVNFGSGLAEGPIAPGGINGHGNTSGDPNLVIDPTQWAYPWAEAFSKTRAGFLVAGFRHMGFMYWRSTLVGDPDPQCNKNLYANGNLMWLQGSCLCFPRGIKRPSLTFTGAPASVIWGPTSGRRPTISACRTITVPRHTMRPTTARRC